MERRLKEELLNYYEAPKPKRKQEFVRNLGVPRMNLIYLTLLQVKYISKWTWICSVLFCGMTYVMACSVDERYAKAVFAILPFYVMTSVTESMRSYRYGMEELELSARFSLKSIVMARLIVLGACNMTVLAIVAGILVNHSAGIHLVHVMTPYFLTAGGGLYIVRNVRGNENVIYCFILAATVCMLEYVMQLQYAELFLQKNVAIWALVCIAGVCMTVRESYRTIRMTEDLAWN